MQKATAMANENDHLFRRAERENTAALWNELADAYERESEAWKAAAHRYFEDKTRSQSRSARERATRPGLDEMAAELFEKLSAHWGPASQLEQVRGLIREYLERARDDGYSDGSRDMIDGGGP